MHLWLIGVQIPLIRLSTGMGEPNTLKNLLNHKNVIYAHSQPKKKGKGHNLENGSPKVRHLVLARCLKQSVRNHLKEPSKR